MIIIKQKVGMTDRENQKKERQIKKNRENDAKGEVLNLKIVFDPIDKV